MSIPEDKIQYFQSLPQKVKITLCNYVVNTLGDCDGKNCDAGPKNLDEYRFTDKNHYCGAWFDMSKFFIFCLKQREKRNG